MLYKNHVDLILNLTLWLLLHDCKKSNLLQDNRSHKIYNAFLLPYGKTENENNLVPLEKTTEDWYDEAIIKEKEYLQIRAIRLDTKSLMYNHSVANDETLSFLVELIKTM